MIDLKRNAYLDYGTPYFTMNLVLGRLSDLTKDYLIIKYPIVDDEDIIYLPFNNINEFMGGATFNLESESSLIEKLELESITSHKGLSKGFVGAEYLYSLKPYYLLGMMKYRYAQMDINRPLLFNADNIIKDYRALISSSFSLKEITNKINEFFKSGKYVNDIALPLLNGFDDDNEFLDRINEPIDFPELERQVGLIKSSKTGIPASINDVFINTLISRRGNDIAELEFTNIDIFNSFNKLTGLINKKINAKISGENEDDFDFLSDIENIDLSFDELDTIEL